MDNAETAELTGHGFYIGVYGADGGVETRVNGPRGGPGGPAAGSLTAEFGDHGVAAGLLGQ